MTFLEKIIAAAFCLILTIGLGFFINPFLGLISGRIDSARPKGISKVDWDILLGFENDGNTKEGNLGGMWIGIVERGFFFISLWAGSMALVFAWLAFKVASKWEAWSNVTRIPESLPNVSKIKYLVARKRWAVRTYQRFLLGTLLNLLTAMIGFGIYELINRFQLFAFIH